MLLIIYFLFKKSGDQSFNGKNIQGGEGGVEETETAAGFEGADKRVRKPLVCGLLVSFALTPISPSLIFVALSVPVPVSLSNSPSNSSSISAMSYNRDLGITVGDNIGTNSGCIGSGLWL